MSDEEKERVKRDGALSAALFYADDLSAESGTVARHHAVNLAAALRETQRALGACERARDDWRGEFFKARDALFQFNYPPDPITLRSIADEIDCGRDCEVGYTEHDTNAFVCRKEERGECGWSKAEELRGFANAIEARAALAKAGGA